MNQVTQTMSSGCGFFPSLMVAFLWRTLFSGMPSVRGYPQLPTTPAPGSVTPKGWRSLCPHLCPSPGPEGLQWTLVQPAETGGIGVSDCLACVLCLLLGWGGDPHQSHATEERRRVPKGKLECRRSTGRNTRKAANVLCVAYLASRVCSGGRSRP